MPRELPPLPYLTADLPGVGGAIKQCPEDFQVDELPLYEASGEGTHVYFRVRKVGLPTPAVVGRMARYLGRRRDEIGFAGLKDAHAVTTQWMSVEHADERKVAAFADDRIRVLEVARHTNKLRSGHLAGNRFVIRIRGVAGGAAQEAARVLDVLTRRGVPNYFGQQRFGERGDTWALGEALVRGDLDRFAHVLLGGPRQSDPKECQAARAAFDAGDFDEAGRHWPGRYHDQRRALAAYRKRQDPRQAVAAVDKRMRRLFVSAFQSAIFNRVLSRRLDALDRVLVGDVAKKTDTGGIFHVTDAEAEQPRAERFEISPTGPVVGYSSPLAEGEGGRIEREVLAEFAVEPEQFRSLGSLKAKGTRRPLRFRIEQATLREGVDDRGAYLETAFLAPSGCYATVVLREMMKHDEVRMTNDE